ncbi:MAG: hypothetical protein LAO07_17745 [Acidobacteriia bacterium]|nr:hypothetical protein [Terriglobia bacterium]
MLNRIEGLVSALAVMAEGCGKNAWVLLAPILFVALLAVATAAPARGQVEILTPTAPPATKQDEKQPEKPAANSAEKPADQQAQPEAQAEEPAPSSEEPDQNKSRTYTMRNGTLTYGRTEQTQKKKTVDGEIETQRVSMPSYAGDRRVIMEREVRTKTLPDGTIEKEYVLKNPDGSDRLAPTEIIRERIKKTGDTTTTEREILGTDYAGHWTPIRKEQVTENGTKEDKQSVKEVRIPSLEGGWRVVDREVTSEKATEAGTESRSVRQTPDAYGRLSDYEVKQERTTTEDGKEKKEVTTTRRDSQDADHPKFFLVEHTVSEQTKSPDGKTTTKSTTESDLLAGGATRNITPGAPPLVEQKTEVETPGQDGASRKVTTVEERGAVDRQMRPSHQVIQETDRSGHVRQIFILME